MIIGLTGASGHVGARVTELLADTLERGDLPGVSGLVAITRSPQKLSLPGPPNVEVRSGDFDDPGTLDTALAGIDRLLLVSTDSLDPTEKIRQHLAAIDAAVRAGVRHVVYTSITDPTAPEPRALNLAHGRTEEHLREQPLAWTILRNNIYIDLLPQQLLGPSGDRIVTNAAEGAAAYVSREDCAAVAAAVLAAPEGTHDAATLEVTGPEALAVSALLPTLERLVESTIELVHVDDAAYTAGLAGAGLPLPVASLFAGFGIALRSGHYAAVSDVVPLLLGRPAQTVDDVLRPGRVPTTA